MTWLIDSALSPMHILLVEDDDGDAKAVRRTFLKARIANPIVRALDGIEALEVLKGAHERTGLQKPYLLLVDLNMPRMNGIELVTTIRKDAELRETVVFMLTTSNREEDKQDAFALNVTGYILKERMDEDFRKLLRIVDSNLCIAEVPPS